MKPASQMTDAEKYAFKRRPDVQKELVILKEYMKMLKKEADASHNKGKMPKENFHCLLRGALGFDHPSMSDPRAPYLPLSTPYLLEEIEAICKTPRVISVNGHLVVPQVIPELNNAAMNGGKRRKSRRTRKNNRR
jgi:hypothetical protein